MEGARVEIAPFRTIADFATDANFSSPAVGDSSRWYNRVKQNLLYYQTNYFAAFIFITICYSAMNLHKYLTGMFILSLLLGAVSLRERTQYGPAPAIAIGIGAGLMGHGPAIFYTLCSFLIPIIFTVGHASIRSRNVKNKVNSAVETLRVVPTPMGHLIECLEGGSSWIRSLSAQVKVQ